ncbi:hypothetical protein LTR53_012780 [Teratosphaeriaceae sp. CCFEE 6253]|nr:hypothetical protein LTR53_012780 [Teratosphaeriaceae sp. CCFEE 6253]
MEDAKYEFVNGYAQSSQEKRRLDRLARTHAAKIGSDRSQHRRNAPQSSALPGSDLSHEIVSLSRDGGPGSRAPQFHSWPRRTFPRQADDDDLLGEPGRTLSPVFGPQSFEDPAIGGECCHWGCELMQHYLHAVAPSQMSLQSRRERLEMSDRHPIAYHGVLYTAALHRGILRGHYAPHERERMLYHKAAALRLMQAEIQTLRHDRVEMVILSMVNLMCEDPEPDELATWSDAGLLLIPHTPKSCCMNVYGRMKTVTAHARALKFVVDYAGGLQNLSPDTLRPLRITDLVAASMTSRRPDFPNLLTFDEAEYSIMVSASTSPGEVPGVGFRASVPGQLPAQALRTLTRLAVDDCVLGRHRHLSIKDASYHMMIKARNRTQHDLLSLPAWSLLPEAERLQCEQGVYEMCRITATLYSTAVVFPMPTHSGWHLKLLATLQHIFRASAFWMSAECAELASWTLYISSMASYKTAYGEFFVANLRVALAAAGLATWTSVQNVLVRFLWSDIACGWGGRLLWDEMKLQDIADGQRL